MNIALKRSVQNISLYFSSLFVHPQKTCKLVITSEAYESYLTPDSMVTVYMKGQVIETNRAYAKTRSLNMRNTVIALGIIIDLAYSAILKFHKLVHIGD